MAGINAGVPSDRIVAEWHLSSSRVAERARGQSPKLNDTDSVRHVSIPADFNALLRENHSLAVDERMRIRQELNDAFSHGYYIDGYNANAYQYALHRL